MKAPSFSLPDQNGTMHSLDDYKGKWLLVYFYPKDDTPGCTIEACSFRDNSDALLKHNIAVVGISKDTSSSHQKFATKFNLNFPLLSDTSTETIQAYGAWGEKKFMGRVFNGIIRNSYLVNPDGELVKTYVKVNPALHTAEIISDVEKLSGKKNI
jgi:peroxiredoxin Q/BCP